MAQIGVDLGNYTFDASAKTITFTGVTVQSIEQIKPIVNGERAVVIFNPAESGKFGSLSNNVLTLDFDTTSYADTDSLYICVNDKLKQSPDVDAFGRLRVSNPQGIFEAQLTYGLQPLVYEQITNSGGATVTHDSTNRCANMAFSSTGSAGEALMQTYEHFRYQAGKSQQIFISFNFEESATGVTKFAGYSDGTNGIEFITSGGTNSIRILSASSEGNQTVSQVNWNLNTYDDLDLSKVQLMIIDFQALYVGVVRIGFEIGDKILYVHEFMHANLDTNPYIQSANLPIRVGMEVDSGTRTTSMKFICASVTSEGGLELPFGVPISVGTDSITAVNNTRTHFLSIRPKTTFNGFTNRVKIVTIKVSIIVTGNNPVKWELCAGQSINGGTWQDVNTSHSSIEYNTAGTTSGAPTLVLDSGIAATGKNIDTTFTQSVDIKIPITLDAAGAVRLDGTLSLLLTGAAGNSDAYAFLKWIEIY